MFSDTYEQLFPLREKVHRRKEKLTPDCARDGMGTAGSGALGSDGDTGTRCPAQSQGQVGAGHWGSDITLGNHQTRQGQERRAGLCSRSGHRGPFPGLSRAQLRGHSPFSFPS